MRKLVYSPIALSKRKKIKREVKERYGKGKADSVSNHISKVLADLKKFPDMGTSMREKYDLDCDYYVLFIAPNYFIYCILDDSIMILEIFNEKEDFMFQLFGIVTISQETLDYWKE